MDVPHSRLDETSVCIELCASSERRISPAATSCVAKYSYRQQTSDLKRCRIFTPNLGIRSRIIGYSHIAKWNKCAKLAQTVTLNTKFAFVHCSKTC